MQAAWVGSVGKSTTDEVSPGLELFYTSHSQAVVPGWLPDSLLDILGITLSDTVDKTTGVFFDEYIACLR